MLDRDARRILTRCSTLEMAGRQSGSLQSCLDAFDGKRIGKQRRYLHFSVSSNDESNFDWSNTRISPD